jgi:very-short-patch-repair endonuclease
MNDRASNLRKNPTQAEQALWQWLRTRQMEGHEFRRQHTVAGFIGDFVCVEQRLIVEVDGGQNDAQCAYNDARTALLESAGWRVLRFWNNEVLQQTEAVVEAIRLALSDPNGGPDGGAADGKGDPSPGRREA